MVGGEPENYDSHGVLNGVAADDLLVYKNRVGFRSFRPLVGSSFIIPALTGQTYEGGLYVEVPRIWYILVAAGTREPITSAAFVPIPEWMRIEEFRDAVKSAHDEKYLKDIDVEYLKVYTKSSQEPLGVESMVGPFGGSSSQPLLVELPTLQYRLVTRKREAITGAAAVFLSDMNSIEDFRDAVKKTHDRLLKDIDAAYLEVYTEWGQEPLDGKAKIRSLGNAKTQILHVVVPKIWYQLFGADTRKSITRASFFSIPTYSNVVDLCAAVKGKHDGAILDGIDPSLLKVYRNLTMYGDPAVFPTERGLQSDEIIGKSGKTAATALIVEVPRKPGSVSPQIRSG